MSYIPLDQFQQVKRNTSGKPNVDSPVAWNVFATKFGPGADLNNVTIPVKIAAIET